MYSDRSTYLDLYIPIGPVLAEAWLGVIEIDHRKTDFSEVKTMGYAVAWLLGIPVTVLAIWFIVTHI